MSDAVTEVTNDQLVELATALLRAEEKLERAQADAARARAEAHAKEEDARSAYRLAGQMLANAMLERSVKAVIASAHPAGQIKAVSRDSEGRVIIHDAVVCLDQFVPKAKAKPRGRKPHPFWANGIPADIMANADRFCRSREISRCYIAADRNGQVWAYVRCPAIAVVGFSPAGPAGQNRPGENYQKIGLIGAHVDNWRNSLITYRPKLGRSSA